MRPATMNAMDIMPNALPRQLRGLRWGVLLPFVMLVCAVYWGVRPWTVLVITVAAVVALLAPAVAAGLTTIALIGFASCAFALCGRDSNMPPGSGTTRGYPLHSLLFGPGMPHVVDLMAGLVMLACEVCLVPATLGKRGSGRA